MTRRNKLACLSVFGRCLLLTGFLSSMAITAALNLPSAFATEQVDTSTTSSKLTAPLYEGKAHMGKVSSRLLEARSLVRKPAMIDEKNWRPAPALPTTNGLLHLELRFRSLTPEIVDQVQATGVQLKEIHYDYGRVYCVADPQALDALAAIAAVVTIHPNYPARRNTGSVDNQADSSIHADLARDLFQVDGSGIDIGILSDSFNDTIGGSLVGTGCSTILSGSGPQISGDLPANVVVLDNGPADETGVDEGAALAELIHDLAPGAGIMFHSSSPSAASMAQGIDELRACGTEVIIDDITYFAEPMFQDGIIAQAAQRAVNNSVAYFSSAGNQATLGADEFYLDANPTLDNTLPTGDDFHDFDSGDPFASITVPPGCGIALVLQWNEPFDGVLGPGASSDLDLYLCTSENPADCIFSSAGVQGCGFGSGIRAGDPLEITGVVNTGTLPATIHAAVEHHCGNDNTRFRIVPYPIEEGCNFPEAYGFESGIFDKSPIYGHAAAAGVAAVGAVFYGEIDMGGDFSTPFGVINVEPYSSTGGDLPFYFDGNGNPLPGAPVTRFKPEIVAPDGTNTSFFWNDSGFDPDSFPNFFGTSASAGHAAGVAALVLDRNQSLSPTAVLSTLMSTATDIELPGTDTRSGAGLIDAALAVGVASPAARYDFNADGMSDILWRYRVDGRNALWQMSGFTALESRFLPSVPVSWAVAGVCDFDADQIADILWRDDTGQNAIWLMNGATPRLARLIPAVPLSWAVAGAGDFNADDRCDFLWRNIDGSNALWLMDGVTPVATKLIAPVSNSWSVASVDDFNGDNQVDILWRDAVGQNAIWLMDGFSTLQASLIPSVLTDWAVAGTGDFNGDGNSDILWRDVTGRNALWLMNGVTRTAAKLISPVPVDWAVAATGDYNGDLKADILWRNDSGQNALWLMNGFATEAAQLIPPVLDTSWEIQ